MIFFLRYKGVVMDVTEGNGIHEYLTFRLADEIFAINVGNIKEILAPPRITRVPRMPEYMSGVINLRGSVIPVLDLRLKFGMGETPLTADTGIIVTEIRDLFEEYESRKLVIGIFSDSVEKVVTIESSEIEPPPKIGMTIDTDFITGMGKLEDSFVIILNIDRILTGKELMVEQERVLIESE